MSADWLEVRLEDVTSKLGDGLHGTPKYDDNGEYYFINGNNLGDGKITIDEKTKRATKEEYLKHKKELNDRTILVSINGTIGNVGLYNGEKVFLGKSACYFNVNEEVDKQFIRYVVTSKYFQDHIRSLATGSTIKNVSLKLMRNFTFSLPPLKTQKEISKVLEDLDRKIELNRQTNQTLEQIAQAIFKSWFVDFEPTRAKIAAKQIAQARQDSERSAALREALLADGRWSEAVATAIAEGDPERAAMAAISGAVQGCTNAAQGRMPKAAKSLDKIDQLDVQGRTNAAGAGAASPEQQTQLLTTAALFPDALVDSELGEIPEGWDIAKLGELLEFNPKRTLKKGVMAPYLDMKNVPTQGHLANDVYVREMASGTKFVNGDTLLARITPCLENGKTAYVDFLEKDQVAWGSTEYIVMRPKNGRPMSLGYIIARLDSFRSKAIQTMTGTSGRQRANAKALSEQEWINYPLELLDAFDRIAGSYLAKAKANGDENKTLEKARDALLPKLLSGELKASPNQTELDKTA